MEASSACVHETNLGAEASEEVIITQRAIWASPIQINPVSNVLRNGESLLDHAIVLHGERGPSLAQIIQVFIVGNEGVGVVLVLCAISQSGESCRFLCQVRIVIVVCRVIITKKSSTRWKRIIKTKPTDCALSPVIPAHKVPS